MCACDPISVCVPVVCMCVCVCVFHYALYNRLLLFSVEKTSPSFSLVCQDDSRIIPLKSPLLWLFTGWQDYTEASCWLTKLLWGFLLVDKTALRFPVGWQNCSEASCWLTKLLRGFLLFDKTALRLPVGWQNYSEASCWLTWWLKNTHWGNSVAIALPCLRWQN